MEGSQLNPQSYIDVYPELFAKLTAAGWTGEILPTNYDKPTWAKEACFFSLNLTALDFILQFEGLSIEAPSRVGRPGECTTCIRFYPDLAFFAMHQCVSNYQLDVQAILEDPEPFPVAEANGRVLFMTQSCRAAFIDQTLCGYIRAPNPFVLLNAVLFDTDGDSTIESDAVAIGYRIMDHSCG